MLGIGPGAVIDLAVLRKEIKECKIGRDRLFIDPYVGIIEQKHRNAETELKQLIGSTGEGVGAATACRVLRKDIMLAYINKGLQDECCVRSVADLANHALDLNKNVFLEGTQGFGLSLYHGKYPFVTSRDTTASALCSEAGISPRSVREIMMVIRTYPIRTGGNSGPLKDEIDWETLTRDSKSPVSILEKTTVTGRIRRVAKFDIEEVKRAITVNRPTQLAVNFIDYIDNKDYGKSKYEELTQRSKHFIEMIENETGIPVTLIGTGPYNEHIIDLRNKGRQ